MRHDKPKRPYRETGDGPRDRPPHKVRRPPPAKPAAERLVHKGPARLDLDLAAAARDAEVLRRHLEAQADRRWERVYAELSALIGADDALKEQVLEKLDEVIARQVERVPPSERFPCGLRRAGREGFRLRLREGDLYVDPKSGVIRRAKRREQRAPARVRKAPKA